MVAARVGFAFVDEALALSSRIARRTFAPKASLGVLLARAGMTARVWLAQVFLAAIAGISSLAPTKVATVRSQTFPAMATWNEAASLGASQNVALMLDV